MQSELDSLETQLQQPEVWKDHKKLNSLNKEKTAVESKLNEFNSLDERFIEIKGSDIQVEPFAEASQASGFTNSRTGLFSSEKSLVPQTGENGITGNKFVVRITSRDTGKKVDLVLNFTSTEKR